MLRAAALLSALSLPIGACRGACARTQSKEQGRVLRGAAWDTVEAATARILPTDDLPGAREANAVGFIDAQLALPQFEVFQRELLLGVGVLDLIAQARFGKSFLGVSDDERDQVLQALADGEGSVHGFDSTHCFDVLFTLTIEGTFSDPVHGGNRDQAGWRLLGYTPGEPTPGHHHG